MNSVLVVALETYNAILYRQMILKIILANLCLQTVYCNKHIIMDNGFQDCERRIFCCF